MRAKTQIAPGPSTPTALIEQPKEPKGRESRKTRYTKQVICEAFIKLMQEQSIEKVTVTRICELADVSRGTFYLHYRDAYDLLECMEDEFLADLERQFMAKTAESTSDYSEDSDFWLDILNCLLEIKDLAQMFFTNPNSSFLTKCLTLNRSYADELCRREFPDMSQQERNYMHTFYEHGSASVIGLWVREGFLEPPEQIAAILTSLNLKH